MNTKQTLRRLLAATIALGATAAYAGPTCTQEPRTSWMTPEEMQKRIYDAGYAIKKFKITDGNCYEIYGHDKRGGRVEIYYNPVDGAEIRRKAS
ncbi:MAG: PepSY domain-containing protein [Rhodocyclaceae bacterium]|nr:PepSY domain-containing protein [Rhodocyclaceae bacterium]